MSTTISRRGFLTGITAILAAPMVCKSEILMPIKNIIIPDFIIPKHFWFDGNSKLYVRTPNNKDWNLVDSFSISTTTGVNNG